VWNDEVLVVTAALFQVGGVAPLLQGGPMLDGASDDARPAVRHILIGEDLLGKVFDAKDRNGRRGSHSRNMSQSWARHVLLPKQATDQFDVRFSECDGRYQQQMAVLD